MPPDPPIPSFSILCCGATWALEFCLEFHPRLAFDARRLVYASLALRSFEASVSPSGTLHLFDFHGLTFIRNMVSISSRDLPLVSGRKKKTTSTATKLHAANKYPYAKPIWEVINGVQNPMKKFASQLPDAQNPMAIDL